MNSDSNLTPSSPRLQPTGRPPKSLATIASQAMVFVFAAALIALVSYRLIGHPQSGVTVANDSGPTDNIPWQTDLPAALAQSKKTGKPVLVDFSATWCPPCQQMKHHSWPDPQVEQIVKSDYIPVSLDADHPEQSSAPGDRYGIHEIPAILVLDSSGNVIRQGAFMPAEELLAFLHKGNQPG